MDPERRKHLRTLWQHERSYLKSHVWIFEVMDLVCQLGPLVRNPLFVTFCDPADELFTETVYKLFWWSVLWPYSTFTGMWQVVDNLENAFLVTSTLHNLGIEIWWLRTVNEKSDIIPLSLKHLTMYCQSRISPLAFQAATFSLCLCYVIIVLWDTGSWHRDISTHRDMMFHEYKQNVIILLYHAVQWCFSLVKV